MEGLMKLLEKLDGYKTILGAALYALSAFLFALKAIDESNRQLLDGVAQAVMVYGFYAMVKRNLKNK